MAAHVKGKVTMETLWRHQDHLRGKEILTWVSTSPARTLLFLKNSATILFTSLSKASTDGATPAEENGSVTPGWSHGKLGLTWHRSCEGQISSPLYLFSPVFLHAPHVYSGKSSLPSFLSIIYSVPWPLPMRCASWSGSSPMSKLGSLLCFSINWKKT